MAATISVCQISMLVKTYMLHYQAIILMVLILCLIFEDDKYAPGFLN